MDLCLIHTADLHGRLTPAKAARLGELKAARGGLLVDCGDAVSSPNLVALPWADRAVRLMNQAGYDAMCLGNREYAVTRRGLRAKTGEAHFPVLAANLIPRGKPAPQLHRWIVLETPAGLRVGLFGLSVPLVNPGGVEEGLIAYRYTPPLEAAREAVAALRGQTDLLVALTHYGQRDEHELIGACPELDVVLCGHWHETKPSLVMVGRTALARTFAHARGAALLCRQDGVWRQEACEL